MNISRNHPIVMINSTTNKLAWYYVPLRSKSETVGFLFLYCLLVIVIMTGNTLVIVAYRYSPKVRLQDTNLFFVSLAVSDLLVGAVSVPLWMYYVYCSHTGDSHCHEHYFVKYFYRNFDVLSAFASIAHLTIISIERRIVTSRLRSMVRSPRKCKYYVPVSAWLYAVSVSIAYAICYKQNFKAQRTLLVFFGGFIIPVAVIASMYFGICRTMNDADKRLAREGTAGALFSRSENRREKKVAATVAILIVLFILCWLPFFVVSMMFTFCQSCLPRGVYIKRLMDFMKFMHYSNSAINPCVYSYRNTEIKEAILRFIAGLYSHYQSPVVRRRNQLDIPDYKQ